MTCEIEEYTKAEQELEALEALTGKPCKIIAGDTGTYQAVVIGSVAHFDTNGSRRINRTTPMLTPDEGVKLEW